MTSVNSTPIKKPTTVDRAAVKSVATTADQQGPGAGRGVGEMLSGATGKAMEMGKDAAQKGANVLVNAVATGAEDKARHLFKASVLNRIVEMYAWMNMLPFGGNIFSAVVTNFFYPYYKQVNPESKLTADEILHSLKHGHTDSLENEVFETFDKFIKSNLSEDQKVKYESGDKMVVFNAFKNLTMAQISTAREPGGIKKICGGIANWIPFVNKLPDSVKPWAGGAIGVVVAYKLAKFAWRIVKWGIAMFAGVTGLKFLANKFGGGAGAPPGLPAMPGEEAPAEGGGVMSKIMSGVNKAAQMASQVQGGGGHGAPGGGFGEALKALAGGAGGH